MVSPPYRFMSSRFSSCDCASFSFPFYKSRPLSETIMSYTPLDDQSEKGRGPLSIRSGRAEDDDIAEQADISNSGSSSSRKMNPSLSEPLTGKNANANGNGNSSSPNRNGDGYKSSLSSSVVSEQQQQQQDPFFVFREDLYRKLETVDESLAEFLRIVHQTDTAVNTHELKDAKKQLKRHIKNAELTLNDVQMTVQLIENDRDKFQEISENELYERSSLCHTSRDRLNKAKEEMTSSAVKAKMLQDERTKAVRRAGVDSLGAKNDAERMNTAFIVDSQARTSLLMQHQDETLDELDAAVTRVSTLAEHIHDEVGQQNKMLTEMEDDLADAEEQLGVVMGKLGKFLQTKDRFQLGTIMALFFTVVILFFLVVYT